MSAIPYEYYYDYSYTATDGALAGMGGFFLVFIVVFYLLMLGFSLLTYILHSMGLYTVAKRRGIQNPWLSWIPLGSLWILGSISDQYQHAAKNRVRNRRKVLLGLTVGAFSVCFFMLAGAILMAISGGISDMAAGAMAALLLLGYFAICILGVILTVFQYIAYYDYFNSCEQGNAVLYLVLSIFLGVTLPFLVFSCRNSDQGMPLPLPQIESQQST